MKYKKIIMVSLLLVIIAMGAVSAVDDNVTSDELTLDDDFEVESSVDDIDSSDDDLDENDDSVLELTDENDDSVLQSSDEEITIEEDILKENDDETIVEAQENQDVLSGKTNVTLTVDMPAVIELSSPDDCNEISIPVYFDKDVEEGDLELYIDGKFITETDLYCEECFFIDDGDLNSFSAGTHNWEVKFKGNDLYNPTSVKGTFKLWFMGVDFPEYIYSSDSQYVIINSYKENVGGNIELYINNKRVYNGKLVYDGEEMGCPVPITGLTDYGEYTYRLVHSSGWNASGTFVYGFIGVKTDIEPYGKSSEVYITLPADSSGTVEVFINGKSFKKFTVSEDNTDFDFSVDNFKFGENNLTVKFTTKNSNYPSNEYSTVVTTTPEIEAQDKVAFCDNLEISLALPSDAKGNLVAYIDDKLAGNSTFTNGKAVISLEKLAINENGYNLVVKYDADDYAVEELDIGISVIPKIVLPTPENHSVTFELPSNATGTLHVVFDFGEEVDVGLKNGKATVNLPDFEYGCPYYLEISYSGNYPEYEELLDFEFEKIKPTVKVTLPSKIVVGTNSNIVFTLPADANGYLTLDYDFDCFYGDVVNGKGIVGVEFEQTGTYTVYYSYEYDNKYQDVSGSFKVVVLPKGKITASDLVMPYTSDSAFKVKVYNGDGSLASGVSVVIKVSGKKVATVKTNSKGVATYKPIQTPGNYKISATALGITVTKKLKVNQILTLKAVKVKKSAKKLVLTATLAKVNKKYLKSKKIIFKFNGKVLTAKTNKKGVAKVTIKKALLKKLKVGKKITYQATYLKTTVKKAVKVQK